jgi:probable phosphoglycerate mutase
MIHLYIFRHTETEWNVAQRMQGRGDSPVTERGRELALELRERLRDYNFDRVFASPMGRAVETANIVLGDRYRVEVDDRLAEMDFGDLDGSHMPTVKAAKPEIADALWVHPENYVPLGNGETYQQVMARAREFLDFLASEYVGYAGSDGPDVSVGAFSHSVMLHSFWTVIEELDVRFFRGRRSVRQCSVTHAVYDGRWHLVSFGD